MSYEQDDGPLTEEQSQKIRELSSATGTPAEAFVERLFDLNEEFFRGLDKQDK